MKLHHAILATLEPNDTLTVATLSTWSEVRRKAIDVWDDQQKNVLWSFVQSRFIRFFIPRGITLICTPRFNWEEEQFSKVAAHIFSVSSTGL